MADELQKDMLETRMTDRIRGAVQQGMVPMLNTGYPKGKKLHIAKHGRTVEMPEPGATFNVPKDVAEHIMRMPYRTKVQMVTGSLPQNFTPPPGYQLVPVEAPELGEAEVTDVMDLVDEQAEEQESNE